MPKKKKPDGRRNRTGNRMPVPLPAKGTRKEDLEPRAVVAMTFHPTRDIWWVVWHDPPALITLVAGRVSGVTEYLRGQDAFAKMMELHEGARA